MPAKEQVHKNDSATSKSQASQAAAPAFDIQSQQPYGTTATQPPRLDLKSLTPARVLQLQRMIGNQAVQRLISDAEAETQPKTLSGRMLSPAKDTVQRVPNRTRADQTANIAQLNTFKSNANTRFQLTNDFGTKSLEVGDLTRNKLSQISAIYQQAYTNFRTVLNRAQQEAQNQQDWTNIIVGVAMGVAAGLIAAWALPASASAAFVLTLEEAAIAAASSAGQAVGGAAATAGATSVLDVQGRTIDSSGLDPSIMELAIWRKTADIYRAGLEYNRVSGQLHTLTVNLSDLIGNVRVYQAGGESALNDQSINEAVTAMTSRDTALAALNTELTTKLTELEALKQAVNAINPSARPAAMMEKDIWILWMSSLPRNSNILDLDAIEDHIGPKGLRIVDFGIYTSDDDENEAIENARDTASMLRAQQQQTLNPGSEANVPADPNRQLRILTR
jgi:hypothetical protein